MLDVARALSAPHEGEDTGEPLFPPSLRPLYMQQTQQQQQPLPKPLIDNNDSHTDHYHNNSSGSRFRYGNFPAELLALSQPNHVNWRFRVPDEEEEEDISFVDGHMGPQSYRAGSRQ